jgi:heat shock protein HslJ
LEFGDLSPLLVATKFKNASPRFRFKIFHGKGVVMRRDTIRLRLLLAVLAIVFAMASSIVMFIGEAYARGANELAGTSWKLVRLQGGDETMMVPDDGSKYTITFRTDGRVVARVDCNRGSSTWKSNRPNELQFGSWSMTRAKCPAGSLHDRIVREGAAVRSYTIKDGHLFLSGMAAGGFYELEPLPTQKGRTPGKR